VPIYPFEPNVGYWTAMAACSPVSSLPRLEYTLTRRIVRRSRLASGSLTLPSSAPVASGSAESPSHRIMRSKVLNEAPERTFAVIFDASDEVVSGLTRFAEERNLSGSSFTTIGAFATVVLGYLDWEKKDYKRTAINEQVEVLALVGDVALDAGKPKIHAHVVLGMRDASARGGHLLQARVRPTREVILTESPGYLKREFDPTSGLALIKIGH
jgi:predicted DNA-binding protein with PD1-like motif